MGPEVILCSFFCFWCFERCYTIVGSYRTQLFVAAAAATAAAIPTHFTARIFIVIVVDWFSFSLVLWGMGYGETDLDVQYLSSRVYYESQERTIHVSRLIFVSDFINPFIHSQTLYGSGIDSQMDTFLFSVYQISFSFCACEWICFNCQ